MDNLNTFAEWLKVNTSLSETSINHYKSGISAISKQFYDVKVLDKPLTEMNSLEIEIAILILLSDKTFLAKDETGRRMYSNAIKHYASFSKDELCPLQREDAISQKINDDVSISVTERSQIIKSRIGQGTFKQRLLEKYNCKCIMTGITDRRLLIASHVKPWSVSSNSDRLSVDNGLLLSPMYDKLFDLGLISFSNKSELLISSDLKQENQKKLGLVSRCYYELLMSTKLSENLEYHRDCVFLQ